MASMAYVDFRPRRRRRRAVACLFNLFFDHRTKVILGCGWVGRGIGDAQAGLYDSVPVRVATPAQWVDPAVGLPILTDAVRQVWASVWSERAVVERETFGLGHAGVAMAVLVQPFLDDSAVLANGVRVTSQSAPCIKLTRRGARPVDACLCLLQVALSDQGARSSTVVNSLPGAVERVTGPSPGVLAEQLVRSHQCLRTIVLLSRLLLYSIVCVCIIAASASELHVWPTLRLRAPLCSFVPGCWGCCGPRAAVPGRSCAS